MSQPLGTPPPEAPARRPRAPRWGPALARTWQRARSDRISLYAAGCAFWATLSLFPAISMLVSLYGLAFDPQTVEPQLATLRHVIPPPAYALIEGAVHTLVSRGVSTLGFSLLVSTAFALWSASTGTKSLLSALNLAYGLPERRGILRFQATGVLITLGSILAAIFALAFLVLLPAAITALGLEGHEAGLLQIGSRATVLVFLLLALAVLYCFGPSHERPRWRWVTPGSLLATALWLLASALFSLYVQRLGRLDATYGPLGAVAGLMLWFWVSAYAVLVGAELDAALAASTDDDDAARAASR
jgi:membrane protein